MHPARCNSAESRRLPCRSSTRPIRRALGASLRNSSNRLQCTSAVFQTPVASRSGLMRLAARPSKRGSSCTPNSSGVPTGRSRHLTAACVPIATMAEGGVRETDASQFVTADSDVMRCMRSMGAGIMMPYRLDKRSASSAANCCDSFSPRESSMARLNPVLPAWVGRSGLARCMLTKLHPARAAVQNLLRDDFNFS